MPAPRKPMRKIRDVLRLKYSAGLSHRQIAAALNLSIGVVSKYLTNAKLAGIVSYPLPDHISDRELEQIIFPPSVKENKISQFVLPDFSYLHQELKQKGVTLQLLWEEYFEQYQEAAYSYSQFCSLYREWREKLKTSMRQTHRAGEKIFVAVLGASSYCYAEATLSQSLPDWTGSHVRAFEFFGGVPQVIVPDNLKSGVTRVCRYEPEINQTYAEMAAHYQTAVIPARPRKPKDKAKVEVGVQVVERWILARLRKQTFFSLAELNRAIIALVGGLNYRPFKKLPGCRRSAFETIDQPALRPLPAERYVYAEWKKVRVNIDYHVEIDGHYYSVPHSLIKEQLDARLTQRTIEVFHKGERVASHPRFLTKAGHTTLPEHMPKAHRAHQEWTPGRFLNWSLEVGESYRDLVKHLLTARSHPEQGYRSCLGLLSLSRRYGKERLEAACRRALHLGSSTRKSVLSILERGLDRLPLPGEEMIDDSPQPPLIHRNIRGAAYYRNQTSEDMQITNRLQTGH